jgi:hypothetical protein
MGNTAGCASFNEMLEARDPGIIPALTGHSVKSYVCFPEAEDRFILFTYRLPPQSSTLWKKDKQIPSFLTYANGSFIFRQFRNGVSDQYRSGAVIWSKLEGDDANATAAAATAAQSKPGRYDVAVSIDNSEVSFSYSFPNVQKTTTDYMLQIRRATRRMLETYSVNAKDNSQFSLNGYCAEY